jgi:hypothetical protein
MAVLAMEIVISQPAMTPVPIDTKTTPMIMVRPPQAGTASGSGPVDLLGRKVWMVGHVWM